MDNGRVAFFAKSWLGDYPDAENYLALFYSPNFSPAGPDKTHFKNAAATTGSTTKPAAPRTWPGARPCTRRWTAWWWKRSPVISLYYDEVVRLTQNNVRGGGCNLMNQLLLVPGYDYQPSPPAGLRRGLRLGPEAAVGPVRLSTGTEAR